MQIVSGGKDAWFGLHVSPWADRVLSPAHLQMEVLRPQGGGRTEHSGGGPLGEPILELPSPTQPVVVGVWGAEACGGCVALLPTACQAEQPLTLAHELLQVE